MSRFELSGRCALAILLLSVSLACASQLDRKSNFVRVSQHSAERMLVRTGEIKISVEDPEATLRKVEELISLAKGFVERSTSGEVSVSLACRVPAKSLDAVMDQIAALGQLVRRSVSATDVTDRHSDLSARLETSLQLRVRMRELLDQATAVQDLLAIEKELARVQAEIESMEAQLERLDSQIQLSSLSVTLEQKRILGPLGYVGYWTGWALSKLFVIR